MKYLFKSYALNFFAFCGLLFLFVFGMSMIDGVLHPYTGILNIWGFIYVPLCVVIFVGAIVGLGWEYLAKLFGFQFPFNFPYKKIPFQLLYYLLFSIGMFGIALPFITSLLITLSN